jgi:hypothetical protein
MSLNPTPAMQHWLTDPMSYAIQQEIDKHDQALWTHGELCMFALMWTIFDFEAGLVGRCPTCFLAYGRTAEAYGQPAKQNCPDCYSTTFEGGYKAKIVRPAIWTHTAEDAVVTDRHGQSLSNTQSVQSTADFKPATDDYVFRADGSRWQIRDVGGAVLQTGFEFSSSTSQAVGFAMGRVVREDESSVAYLIPPDPVTLRAILSTPVGTRYPPDTSAVDEIRGPLK